MKLTELYQGRRAGSSTSEVTYKEFELNQTKEGWVEPFDLEIKFTISGSGSTYHPYGAGHGREDHAPDIDIDSAKCTKEVKMFDDDEKVIKTFPKGTDVEKMPGWDNKMWRSLEDYAFEHYEADDE